MYFCFYDSPKNARGRNDMDRQFMCIYEAQCDNLKLLLCSDGAHLTRLEFANSHKMRDFGVDLCKILGESKLDCSVDSPNLPIFTQTKKWLDLYFSGEIPQFVPKIAFPNNASAFALRVWEILQSIPHGKTTTYGAIAKQIAREFGIAKMSAQAVGGAVSRNPIAIIIPCHRVLGTNGNLTGYAGGIANKITLLKLEKIPIDSLKMPKI